MAHWWTTFVAIACNWMLGDDNAAESLYSKLEYMPRAFQLQEDVSEYKSGSLEDPLPKAVFAAYMAKKTYISNRTHVSKKVLFRQCNLASQLLSDSLTYNICREQNELVFVSIDV